MQRQFILDLLRDVADGRVNPEDAMLKIKEAPFEDAGYADLGFAKPDTHRGIRQGIPEVIYGAGKTPDQIIKITKSLMESGQDRVLITRVDPEKAEALRQGLAGGMQDQAGELQGLASGDASAEAGTVSGKCAGPVPFDYDEMSRLALAGKPYAGERVGKILVATAGTSDMPVAEEAARTAEVYGNNVVRLYDVGVAGIHRLLDHKDEIMSAKVIIAIAGMEGALASVVGGLADCPVIAVPTSVGYGAAFDGLAALLSMMNSCASGVSVVNIDNGFGAGYLASMINHI